MKIIVTQDDIEHGVREDCESCPLANATERATGLYLVRVQFQESYDISIDGKSYVTAEKDIESVDKFIRDFDKGEKVSPFEFEIARKYDDETEAEE